MEPVCTAANAFFGAKGWHKSQLWVRPGGCCRTIDVFIYWLISLSSRSFTITKRPSLLVCVNRPFRRRRTWELGNQNISKQRFQEYVHLLGSWPGLHKPTHTLTHTKALCIREIKDYSFLNFGVRALSECAWSKFNSWTASCCESNKQKFSLCRGSLHQGWRLSGQISDTWIIRNQTPTVATTLWNSQNWTWSWGMFSYNWQVSSHLRCPRVHFSVNLGFGLALQPWPILERGTWTVVEGHWFVFVLLLLFISQLEDQFSIISAPLIDRQTFSVN